MALKRISEGFRPPYLPVPGQCSKDAPSANSAQIMRRSGKGKQDTDDGGPSEATDRQQAESRKNLICRLLFWR